MSLVCVPILAGDVHTALADAEQARRLGADLVEFRVDHLFHGAPSGGGAGAGAGAFDDEGAAAVERLAGESPLPCIVTCRPVDEGGDYDGDDASRIALFERLGASPRPPRYLDVELSAMDRSANLRQKVRLAVDHPAQGRDISTSLILSTHDFRARPADLLRRLERMRAEPAAKVLKIAYTARSIRENLDLFDLLAERERPTIALAMGPMGLMSRVLAPKFGGFLTFASLRPTSVTAPGQPTIAELLDLYRFRAVSSATRVYGVIGWPVEHSLSPLVHNAAFAAVDPDGLGHDGVYLPLPVAPGWPSFKATLGALIDHPQLDFTGASVTLPHKENLLRFAREAQLSGDFGETWRIDPSALRAGAANTLAKRDDGSWLVTNTDFGAIVACVGAAAGDDLRGLRFAVLGAGGGARAAAAGLADEGAAVTIFARSLDKARALAADLSADNGAPGARIEAADWGARHDGAHDGYINCTPVGMKGGPAPDESPLDADRIAHRARTAPARPPIIFDTVYNPLETPLLREARAHALPTIDGAEMFIKQAAAQSELWTGRTAPAALLDRLVRERLTTTAEESD